MPALTSEQAAKIREHAMVFRRTAEAIETMLQRRMWFSAYQSLDRVGDPLREALNEIFGFSGAARKGFRYSQQAEITAQRAKAR